MLDGALIQVAKSFHLVWKGLVPFLQPCLRLLAEQSYELDHFKNNEQKGNLAMGNLAMY